MTNEKIFTKGLTIYPKVLVEGGVYHRQRCAVTSPNPYMPDVQSIMDEYVVIVAKHGEPRGLADDQCNLCTLMCCQVAEPWRANNYHHIIFPSITGEDNKVTSVNCTYYKTVNDFRPSQWNLCGIVSDEILRAIKREYLLFAAEALKIPSFTADEINNIIDGSTEESEYTGGVPMNDGPTPITEPEPEPVSEEVDVEPESPVTEPEPDLEPDLDLENGEVEPPVTDEPVSEDIEEVISVPPIIATEPAQITKYEPVSIATELKMEPVSEEVKADVEPKPPVTTEPEPVSAQEPEPVAELVTEEVDVAKIATSSYKVSLEEAKAVYDEYKKLGRTGFIEKYGISQSRYSAVRVKCMLHLVRAGVISNSDWNDRGCAKKKKMK